MNRFNKISELYKSASKIGRKGASGMNFGHAELALSEENPGVEISKDQILERISSEGALFSEEDLKSIFEIKIEPHHGKMMNKREKAFIEIGAFLTKKLDKISEIGDYLLLEAAKPGWIEERYDISLSNRESIEESFNKLDQAQREAHEEAARKDAESVQRDGKFGNGYETNEVIHDFGDGWKVVYVPAVGEGPNYKGDSKKSNDRTVEGNINGLCLGETMGLYQNNHSGKIYSVRDSGNNPRVTIRIHGGALEEAKGKQNRSPDIDGAIHADKWFKSQENKLGYKNNYDYKAFPPLTKASAIKHFSSNERSFYEKGWITHWFKKGIPIIDSNLLQKIEEKDILVVYSGIGKKYKELAQPAVRHHFEKWNNESSSQVWGSFWPHSVYQLSHESWKTYKKEPWMRAAVEKLMKEKPKFGFKIGLQKIDIYKEITIEAAELIANSDPKSFFELKLQDDFVQFKRDAAEAVASSSPNEFFRFKLNEDYEDLSQGALEKLIASQPDQFFGNGLQEKYPKMALRAAESASKNKPRFFFSSHLRRSYPALAETAAKNLANEDPGFFIEKQLHRDYPDLVKELALSLSEKDPKRFFTERFAGSHPELEDIAVKNLAKLEPGFFFEKDFSTLFPDLKRTAAESLFIPRRNRGQSGQLTAEDLPPDIDTIEELEDRMSIDGIEQFFYFNLDKTYPDLAKKGAVKLINHEPEIFFNLKLDERPAVSEFSEDAAEAFAEKELARLEDRPQERNYSSFINLGVYKKYQKSGLPIASFLSEENPVYFFKHNLNKHYPELEPPAVQKLIKIRPSMFVEQRLQDNYPELFETVAKNILKNSREDFFRLGLAKSFPDMARKPAEAYLKYSVSSFFSRRLHEVFPDMSRDAAKLLVLKPKDFFSYNLDSAYPEFTDEALDLLIKNEPEYYFDSIPGRSAELIVYGRLVDDYPDRKEEVAERYLEKHYPEYFFSGKLGEMVSEGEFPELAEKAAIECFEKYEVPDLVDKFRNRVGLTARGAHEKIYEIFSYIKNPDSIAGVLPRALSDVVLTDYEVGGLGSKIVYNAIEKISAKDFFETILNHPMLDEKVPETLNLLNDGQKKELYSELTSIDEEYMYQVYNRIKKLGQLEYELLPDEFLKKIPELKAKLEPEVFLSEGEEGVENFENLSQKALEALSVKDFLEWTEKSGLKESLLVRVRKMAYSKMDELISKYSSPENFDDQIEMAYYFLDQNFDIFVNILGGREEVRDTFYSIGGKNFERVNHVIEEIIETDDLSEIISGLCSGIFVWFESNKFDATERGLGEQSTLEDEILYDPSNSGEFFEHYKMAYNFAVQSTGVDTSFVDLEKKYLEEAEGVYEEESLNYFEDGQNPFAELFDRPRTQKELEDEEESLNKRLYNEREEEADRRFYRELDDEESWAEYYEEDEKDKAAENKRNKRNKAIERQNKINNMKKDDRQEGGMIVGPTYRGGGKEVPPDEIDPEEYYLEEPAGREIEEYASVEASVFHKLSYLERWLKNSGFEKEASEAEKVIEDSGLKIEMKEDGKIQITTTLMDLARALAISKDPKENRFDKDEDPLELFHRLGLINNRLTDYADDLNKEAAEKKELTGTIPPEYKDQIVDMVRSGDPSLIEQARELAAAAFDAPLDLSGADLERVKLRKTDLSGVIFNGARLGESDFSLANLTKADFSNADLNSSYMHSAQLRGAKLSGADLYDAWLSEADLRGADISGADLNWAKLSDAKLSGANLSGANLRDARLWNTDLSGANLDGANLDGAYLKGADLSGANLSGARYSKYTRWPEGFDYRNRGVIGPEVNISGADLSGADLSRANLWRADLSGADLSEADLRNAHLGEANLSSAKLSGANLSEAYLDDADLSGANLDGADLSGAYLWNTEYDDLTKWPEGFDYEEHGAIKKASKPIEEEIEQNAAEAILLRKLSKLLTHLDGLGQKEAAKELSELIEKEAAKKKKKKKKKKKSKKKKDRTPTKPDLWQRAIAAAKRKFDVYPCVPVETSYALTREGWKTYSELRIGDEIVSYNRDLDCLQWDEILNLNFFENAPTMRMYKSATCFDFICTEDHNWVIKNKPKKSSKRYKYEDQLVPARSITKNMNIITSARMEDSEGIPLNSFRKREWSWVEKVLAMSNQQREAWLAAAIVYDGHENNYSQLHKRASYGFSQKNDDHAEATEICAALLGYNVSFKKHKKYNPDISSYTFIDRQTHGTQNVIKEPADNCDVWCPETKNGTWLMKQGRMISITGNSAYANGWALQWYKKKGGGWRGKKPVK